MNIADDDGRAVAAARAALTAGWRSTVVRDGRASWVVRTWTRTPRADSRPSGPPDVVQRVSGEAGGLRVEQVHPTQVEPTQVHPMQ